MLLRQAWQRPLRWPLQQINVDATDRHTTTTEKRKKRKADIHDTERKEKLGTQPLMSDTSTSGKALHLSWLIRFFFYLLQPHWILLIDLCLLVHLLLPPSRVKLAQATRILVPDVDNLAPFRLFAFPFPPHILGLHNNLQQTLRCPRRPLPRAFRPITRCSANKYPTTEGRQWSQWDNNDMFAL